MLAKPQILESATRTFVGLRLRMSLLDNKTPQLFGRFMPRRKELENRIEAAHISIEVYPPDYFLEFNPSTEFEKWAAMEVSSLGTIPKEMESIEVPAGLYAIFDYKRPMGSAQEFYGYIYSQWLPKSEYEIDQRPHFSEIDARFTKDDPNMEEKVWIPIKKS